jgi:translation elongation factor P/translation initiation factor 5A
MQYLYTDGEFWHFMVPDTFEQFTAGKEAMGEGAIWLKDGMECTVMLWNGRAAQCDAAGPRRAEGGRDGSGRAR